MNTITSKTMNIHQQHGVKYVGFKNLDQYPNLSHGFTTRYGGVSKDHLGSMNLGFNRGDKKENVIENYRRICKAIGVPYESLVLSDQVHKTTILKVTDTDKGKGIEKVSDFSNVDGLYTDQKQVTLVTHFADCVPLFFYEPNKGIIGLAHAGWRGTVGEIGPKMVHIWEKEYSILPEDIIVGIGPSIGLCCFEVDQSVADQFINSLGVKSEIIEKKENGKYNIDLWNSNRQLLLQAGIAPENICVTDLCTKCNNDAFFSHRGQQGSRGTLGAFMMMK